MLRDEYYHVDGVGEVPHQHLHDPALRVLPDHTRNVETNGLKFAQIKKKKNSSYTKGVSGFNATINFNRHNYLSCFVIDYIDKLYNGYVK
jgi:hypothetical protein